MLPSTVALAEPKNARERDERVSLVIREMISLLQAAPDRTLTVIELCQRPKIQLLKKGIIAKFSYFIQQNAEKFSLGKNPEGDNKSDCVTLQFDDLQCEEYLSKTFELDANFMIVACCS